MEILKSGRGDNRVPKLDYMLWHKHISLDNDQNCEKTCYYRKKTLEYGRAEIPRALKADVLIIWANCTLVMQIRTAVITKQQIIEQRKRNTGF